MPSKRLVNHFFSGRKKGLRPGFLLMDTVLWTTVAGAGILFVVQYLVALSDQDNVQKEARILSALADDAVREALLGLPGNIGAAQAAGGARTIPITDLDKHDVVPVLPRNRDLHLVHHAPDSSTLWILAYTTGTDAGTPLPAPGLFNLGVIDHDGPCGNSAVCGPGLRWSHTVLDPLLTTPPGDGSMVALRLIDADPEGDPFVWQVNSGDPVHTTMTTNLDLAGNMIVNAGDVTSQGMVVQTLLQVNGDTEIAELDATTSLNPVQVVGDLELAGTLAATTMTSDIYQLNTNDVEVANDLPANRIEASGKVTVAGELGVSSNLMAPEITGDITTGVMSVVTLESTATTVGGNVIVNRASTGDLDLDPGQLTVDGILYVARCTGTGCTTGP